MLPQTDTDYKKLFTELVKKQMMILGPEITLSKVKKIQGLQVNQDGEVTSIEGDPQALFQKVINEFVELSGLIVKKTMESVMSTYPGMAQVATTAVFSNTTSEHSQSSVLSESNARTPTIPEVKKEEPKGPPQMADMNLESMKMPVNADVSNSQKPQNPQPPTPTAFSAKEMEDLNKALADLSNAPMGNEGGM